jgi:hypothetical protein
MQHNAGGGVAVFLEKTLQYVDDKFHRRVVVVQDQYAVKARLLRFLSGPGNDSRTTPGAISSVLARLHGNGATPRWFPADRQSLPSFRRA